MIRKLLYLAGGILLLLFVGILIEFFVYKNQREERVRMQGQETTALLKAEVDGILSNIADEGARLADLIAQESMAKSELEELIKESALSIPEIQGVTACFEPYAFHEGTELYCPYYDKGSGDFIFVEESYNYSEIGPSSGWYTSVRDEGAKWVEPYYAKAAQDWYVDYGIPIYSADKQTVLGTITMSFICSGFNNMVHSLSLGKTGFGVIATEQGALLSHPNNDFIGQVNLKDTVLRNFDPTIAEALQRIQSGESGLLEFEDEDSGDETLFFFDQIPTSNWGFGLTFFKNDLLNDNAQLNKRYIRLAVVLSLLLLSLLAIYYNKDYLDRQEIWILSAVGATLLIANIFFIASLQHNTILDLAEDDSGPLVDISALDGFIAKQNNRSDKLKTKRPRVVPTGLFIEKLEYADSYNLNLGGVVWQKYPLDLVEEVSVGFRFPQTNPTAEASLIEEISRDTISGKEDEATYLLVSYEFRTTLRLDFNYEDYPLDKSHINIEIAPLRMVDNILFTPDLSSYDFTNPSKLSGLHSNLSVPGSQFQSSFFNFSRHSYDTDFGTGDKLQFEEVPVLHYNIYLRRQLLNAFVTYLIPIFVVLIMMYILLTACQKTEERQGIIESMAAFFFVLIFSHIDLRKEIVTAELIYMEYFYFATYVMIILTTFNLVVYAKKEASVFDYNENQLFKASYFPFYFLMVLLMTLANFY